MKSYIEYINENTAAQRLYNSLKSQGKLYNPDGSLKPEYYKLDNFVKDIEKAHYWDFLEKYLNERDAEDYYISFRKFDEVGINPRSTFDTPNGVYTYTVKQMFQKFIDDEVPYADDGNFIYVLKSKYPWSKRNAKGTKILTSGFNDYERISHNLAPYIIEHCNKKQIENLMGLLCYFSTKTKRRLKGEYYVISVDYYYPFVHETSEKDADKLTDENAVKFIQENRYFYLKDIYELLISKNVSKVHKITIMENFLKEKMLFCKTYKKYSYFLLTWYITKELSENFTKNEKFEGEIPKQQHDVWNHILRNVLGFEVVVNKKDEEIIHPHEPTQAVFLSANGYEVVNVLDNKRRDWHSRESINKKIKDNYESKKVNNFVKDFLKEIKLANKRHFEMELEKYDVSFRNVYIKTKNEQYFDYAKELGSNFYNNKIAHFGKITNKDYEDFHKKFVDIYHTETEYYDKKHKMLTDAGEKLVFGDLLTHEKFNDKLVFKKYKFENTSTMGFDAEINGNKNKNIYLEDCEFSDDKFNIKNCNIIINSFKFYHFNPTTRLSYNNCNIDINTAISNAAFFLKFNNCTFSSSKKDNSFVLSVYPFTLEDHLLEFKNCKFEKGNPKIIYNIDFKDLLYNHLCTFEKYTKLINIIEHLHNTLKTDNDFVSFEQIEYAGILKDAEIKDVFPLNEANMKKLKDVREKDFEEEAKKSSYNLNNLLIKGLSQ